MEVDNYVLSLQRVITASHEKFDPEKDMDSLNKIASSIRTNCPFLESQRSILGSHEISRKIHLVLFLHTEFDTSKYYVDHDDLACVIGIIPKLNPVFYLLLVDKLKLNEYLKELLFYSSEVVSNNVLDFVNRTMKYRDLDETLSLYEHIIKVIYLKLKYLELEYREKQEDVGALVKKLSISKTENNPDIQRSNGSKDAIKAKYSKFLQNFKTFGFEFCHSLLGSSKVKSFTKDEAVIFEGYLVLSHLQLLIFCTNVECFQNNGENPDVNSKQCVRTSRNVQEFYQLLSGADFDYVHLWTEPNVDARMDLFQDCYGDLLYDLIKVLTPISCEKWLAFHEHEHGDGKTLQTEIGEHAYYLNDLLKQAAQKGYEHTNIKLIVDTYLQHLIIKPLTEEDLILKSLPEQLISAFQENSAVIKTRGRWLDSALRFFNSHHDEIMTIFESNLVHLSCGTVFCLHDMIMDRLLNEELDLSDQDSSRLKQLLLNSLDHLPLRDQIKVVATFVEKYTEELCVVFGTEEARERNEWLNVIDNQSDLHEVCAVSLKHILQSPASTLSKLMTIGLKSRPDHSCMAPVIQSLVELILPHFGSLDLRHQRRINEDLGNDADETNDAKSEGDESKNKKKDEINQGKNGDENINNEKSEGNDSKNKKNIENIQESNGIDENGEINYSINKKKIEYNQDGNGIDENKNDENSERNDSNKKNCENILESDEYYFLLDYFLDVFYQVRHSLEKGEVSFLSGEDEQGEVGGGDGAGNKKKDQTDATNFTLDLNSLSKLSQQDISNLKPMIALLFKKEVLSPSDMFHKCLWPQFSSLSLANDGDIQYEYLSFVTDILLIYFEENDHLVWSASNETLSHVYSVVKSLVNTCTCTMSGFIKEKYFARERLILLLTSILAKYKDNLDLSESTSSHPDWLKLFLSNSSVVELYGLNEDSIVPFLGQFLSRASQLEWTTLACRLSTSDCLVLINVMRVLVQLVESRTQNPETLEPYVNCLHQTVICFSNVFKDIFYPALLKSADTLSSDFKLRLFESLACLLSSFQSSRLEQVKMFAIMSLEPALTGIVDKLLTAQQLKDQAKYLCVLITRIDFLQTRVKLVQSVLTRRG